VNKELKVGRSYSAMNYLESGYNFPEGEYRLKVVCEGFPDNSVGQGEELIVAREQWLEGLEGSEQYKIDLEGNWYYFEFPENEDGIDGMWIPESVVLDVFKS